MFSIPLDFPLFNPKSLNKFTSHDSINIALDPNSDRVWFLQILPLGIHAVMPATQISRNPK